VDRALWLLYWLGLRSWLRRTGNSLRTWQGVVLAGFWVLFLGSCMIGWIVSRFVPNAQPQEFASGVTVSLEQVERVGSLILLGLCLLTFATTTGKGAIVVFLPAEIAFLVAGPFTRRELLAYKLLAVLWVFCITSLVWVFLLGLGFVLRLPSGPLPARYLGMVLAFIFLQLVALDLTSLAMVIGVRAYGRARKIALAILGVFAAAGVLYAIVTLPNRGLGATLEALEQMPLTRALLEVPRWFIRAALAEHYWPDFVAWGGAGLGVNAVLLWLLFKLDAQYVEGAAAAGERLYAQMARIRKEGAGAILAKSSGTARSSLRSLPWWGGVGPVLWRQLQGMARSRTLIFVLVAAPIGLFFLGNWLLKNTGAPADPAPFSPLALAGIIVLLSFLIPGMISADFRRDFDRMDALKTLPIGSAPLAIGQILAPVLCTTLVQALGTAVLAIRAGGSDVVIGLWTVFPLVMPFNFLLVGLDNLVFLLCPSRPISVAPSAAQFSGKKLLLNMGKFLVLYMACAMAGGFAVAVYFLTDRLFGAAIAVAWVVLAAFAAGVVPLLALAFQRYDIARNRPG
jgi:hypothetical protein